MGQILVLTIVRTRRSVVVVVTTFLVVTGVVTPLTVPEVETGSPPLVVWTPSTFGSGVGVGLACATELGIGVGEVEATGLGLSSER